jgi:hypothetical protein
MRSHADKPGVMKDECWVLADGPEQHGDQSWWLTPGTRTRARTWRGGACCQRGETCVQGVRDEHSAILMAVWASKPPNATDGGFCLVYASKLSNSGLGGNRWRHMAS